jgi:choline-sulfatase
MADHPRLKIGLGALAGALGGAAVGMVDGVRVALLVGAGARIALGTAILAASVDALAGLVAGVVAEATCRLAVWGRRTSTPTPTATWARVLAYVVVGAGAAAAAAAVVSATAPRRNRFLAAGLTALAGVFAAVAGAILAPALARVLALLRPKRGLPDEPRAFILSVPAHPPGRPEPALALFGPFLIALAGGVVFVALARTHAPLLGAALLERSLWSAGVAFLLPAGLAWVAALRLPIRWPAAGLLAGGVYGSLVFIALGVSWGDNLRFAPWTDILGGLAIAAAGLGAALWLRRHPPQLPGATAGWAAAVGVLAALVLLRASESEPARKAGTARAALVGPALEAGQTMLDFDGDGYARALGGGDCDDSDPDIHPGAIDLPGDGVDADCDGQDATDALPPPATMAELPASVPPDLNLLLVTIDTLRADHLGCYGYGRATSPAIDALAAESALFENGWAHAPSTRYSMPAIATGRWPSAITWDESIWWPRLGPNMRTTAEALHDDGYFTAGMFSFSYFAIGDHRGFERGMDLYRSDRAVLHVSVNGPMESRGSSSREVTDDAIAFIDAHKDHKFFLWLHYYDPHLSYEPHAEVPSFGSARVDLYDGEIRFTDLHFGRLLARLRAAGLWDKTAIVVTGDHGEGFGEHGVTEHGFDLYTAQTRVPFIVRVPGLAPRRVQAPAGHVDIAPTLVNLARGGAEPSFIGRSLVPDLVGPPSADTETRAVFQEVTSERGKKRAFVTSRRHLIWNETPSDTTECYDRTGDPTEARDIWDATGDPLCTGLSRDLKRMVAGLAFPPGARARMAADVTPAGRTAPAPSHLLDAALGDAIVVRGYDLSAAEMRPGESVEAVAHFAVKQRLQKGWRLFFHLEGPSGGSRNLDHVPVDGLMPLERWRPGQQLRDRFRIALPVGTPPGVYTLYLGAFRAGERLPVSPPALADGRDRLRLFQVTVHP